MKRECKHRGTLGADITRVSSKYTYLIFRLLADRERVEDAYNAYAYFRWVDDILDSSSGSQMDKIVFIRRQRNLLSTILSGEKPQDLTAEEQLLVEMMENDSGRHPGLRSYLDKMMAVMEFDVERRGKFISQEELEAYSSKLATAVTDVMFYLIGHNDPIPSQYGRYHAVTAAHITHMLRDTCEDVQMGYFNIPLEYLQQFDIGPQDIESQAYRKWVYEQVKLARDYFRTGMEYIAQVKNFRCRLAGYAYAARFKWILDVIEDDDYRLRQNYSQHMGIWMWVKIGWSTVTSMLVDSIRLKWFDFNRHTPIEISEL